MNRLKLFTKIFQHYKEPPKVRININSKNSKNYLKIIQILMILIFQKTLETI